TDIGIRIKSNAGRGGLVHNIYVDNITMKNIKNEAILFSGYYEDVPAGKEAKDVVTTAKDKVPEFTDFYIKNIKCDGAKQAVNIIGLPEMQVH
ncbi:glycosyl hydrolase family 28 protein, partial [Acinetobacter baumannii]